MMLFLIHLGMSELLVTGVISSIFLNPFIWVYTPYKVQLELYMFLIQQFDNDPRLFSSLCCLPRILDIIRQFYWDKTKSRSAYASKPLLDPITKEVIGERPSREDIRKIRLLLLSLGEMSLRLSHTLCHYFIYFLFCVDSRYKWNTMYRKTSM